MTSHDKSETLRELAGEMERAADLADRDQYRPVTSHDARRWAEEIRAALSRSDSSA